MLPNLLQYPVCLFGALRAGCAVVNCNPLYTAHELAHQLADSGAQAIVIAENFARTLQQALPRTALRPVVATSVGRSEPRSAGQECVRTGRSQWTAYRYKKREDRNDLDQKTNH